MSVKILRTNDATEKCIIRMNIKFLFNSRYLELI